MVCDWPGNVRQVCNEVQRIIARAEDGIVITPDQLSPELRRMSEHLFTPAGAISPGSFSNDTSAPIFMSAAVEALERKMIVKTLRLHGGNVTVSSGEPVYDRTIPGVEGFPCILMHAQTVLRVDT